MEAEDTQSLCNKYLSRAFCSGEESVEEETGEEWPVRHKENPQTVFPQSRGRHDSGRKGRKKRPTLLAEVRIEMQSLNFRIGGRRDPDSRYFREVVG